VEHQIYDKYIRQHKRDTTNCAELRPV